jgi:hypothetical protein
MPVLGYTITNCEKKAHCVASRTIHSKAAICFEHKLVQQRGASNALRPKLHDTSLYELGFVTT